MGGTVVILGDDDEQKPETNSGETCSCGFTTNLPALMSAHKAENPNH